MMIGTKRFYRIAAIALAACMVFGPLTAAAEGAVDTAGGAKADIAASVTVDGKAPGEERFTFTLEPVSAAVMTVTGRRQTVEFTCPETEDGQSVVFSYRLSYPDGKRDAGTVRLSPGESKTFDRMPEGTEWEIAGNGSAWKGVSCVEWPDGPEIGAGDPVEEERASSGDAEMMKKTIEAENDEKGQIRFSAAGLADGSYKWRMSMAGGYDRNTYDVIASVENGKAEVSYEKNGEKIDSVVFRVVTEKEKKEGEKEASKSPSIIIKMPEESCTASFSYEVSGLGSGTFSVVSGGSRTIYTPGAGEVWAVDMTLPDGWVCRDDKWYGILEEGEDVVITPSVRRMGDADWMSAEGGNYEKPESGVYSTAAASPAADTGGLVKTLTAVQAATGEASVTEGVDGRLADPSTMDDYEDVLLGGENGARYAGRVWADKSVFAAGETDTVTLDEATDGVMADVTYASDFAHVYSLLASSQKVNTCPQSPIDLVLVFDMSGSMAEDTRYKIEGGDNNVGRLDVPAEGIPLADRIENSRIGIELDAMNRMIKRLMEADPQNRVAVVGYGANAAVIMPLAHWRPKDGSDTYLTVGGMETLRHPSDLKTDGTSWSWTRNRDAAFTVVADAKMNNDTTQAFSENPDGASWQDYRRVVSNNVYGGDEKTVKAFPGVASQDAASLAESAGKNKEVSAKTADPSVDVGLEDGLSNQAVPEAQALATLMGTAGIAVDQLDADEYIGYMTNMQGGLYLGFDMLLKEPVSTYGASIAGGDEVRVARTPGLVVLSDGGSNMTYNVIGDGQQWNDRVGGVRSFTLPYDDFYYNDGTLDDGGEDAKHRLFAVSGGTVEGRYKGPDNLGDEWYKPFVPSVETLGEEQYGKGIESLYNLGDDYYKNGALMTTPRWFSAGVLYMSDSDLFGTSGIVLEQLLTAAFMRSAVEEKYMNAWDSALVEEDTKTGVRVFTVGVDTLSVPQWGRIRMYPTLDPGTYSLDALGEEWYTDTSKFGAFSVGAGQTLKSVYDGVASSWNAFKSGQDAKAVSVGGSLIRISIKPIGGVGAGLDSSYEIPGTGVSVSNGDVIDNIIWTDGFFDVESEELDNTFTQILERIKGQAFLPVGGENAAGDADSVTYQDPVGDYMELKEGAILVDGQKADASLVLFGEEYPLGRAGVYDPAVPVAVSEWRNGTSWDDGGTYYLSKEDADLAIPGGVKDGITYTVYGFLDSAQPDKLRMNPAYGAEADIPQEIKDLWAGYEAQGLYPSRNTAYAGVPGVYRLSDISVWAEEFSEGADPDGEISPKPENYSECLFVDVPAAAVPAQVAEITMYEDGVFAYEDNLDDGAASSPLRLFYGVGLKAELIGESGKLDVRKTDSAYLQNHTDEGMAYFVSNYHSGLSYEWYADVSGRSYSHGDSAFTFSAAENDRYYEYQRPLTLYAKAYVKIGDALVEAEAQDSSWAGAELYRVYESFTEAQAAAAEIPEGRAVLCREDRLTAFDEGLSEQHLFLAVDYYVPGETVRPGSMAEQAGQGSLPQAVPVKRVIARKGSEFGSGYHDAGIGAGSMACWYDEKQAAYTDFVQGSGDHGKPADGDYALAAKPGGIRVGDLSQNVHVKSANPTKTAENAYVPVVDISSMTEGCGVVLDSYLGNNGRILAENGGNLSVEKRVEGNMPDGETLDWHFTVTLSDTTVNGVFGEDDPSTEWNDTMTFTDGVAEFTLKHGQKKKAEGLPAGVTFTVTETEADLDNWKTTWEEASTGTIESGTDTGVVCVNRKFEVHMPHTGGPGRFAGLATGVLLTAFGCIGLFSQVRRRRR